MLVSIVIPCYNSEKTIGEVVELCMDTFNKIENYECEMILVNDYSKDKTYEVIENCAKGNQPCQKFWTARGNHGGAPLCERRLGGGNG